MILITGTNSGFGKLMALDLAFPEHPCLYPKYGTLQAAIYFYEINMYERVSVAAKESPENGERMHSENALDTMLNFFSGYKNDF